MPELFINAVLLLLHVVPAGAAAGHALLCKRHPNSAFGWIGICIVLPFVGPLLYFLFGINRVQTQAQRMARRSPFRLDSGLDRGEAVDFSAQPGVASEWRTLAAVSSKLGRRPLLAGNRIRVLHNGYRAFPAMLAAIDRASARVVVASYIFDSDTTGRRFVDALANADRRGVEVCVLIDGLGEFYSLPRIRHLLAQRGVRVERFLAPRLWPPSLHLNLRNHRKILVVDGSEAFIGGMNISDRHMSGRGGRRDAVADVHFGLNGPIASQIETVFAEDWRFATGEVLTPSAPAATTGENGGTTGENGSTCRVLTDGPNEDLDSLTLVLTGAVNAARERVDIMTPYFLPPRELVTALQTAVLRGVCVRILLPERSNLPFVDWATRNILGELLAFGVDVRYQPSPFVHSKLFVIDRHYALVGSPNLDARSLRLNFELATEIYCTQTAQILGEHCDRNAERARPVTAAEIDERALPIRLRDAGCWLFSPYL